MDDSPDRARRTVEDLLGQAYAPSTNTHRFAADDPYNRPGQPDSAHQLHPDMQRVDGWRPSGSWSTSVVSEGRSPWHRNMVVDGWTENDHWERTQNGDNSRYRSGRPKSASGQFLGGAMSGYREG
ncbi:hypothetical protein ABT213_06080 [Streptomyces sp. NPDC001674]|uniref:hypothetical protein n=1 Tax=Streptomyces sp. NPDC001674 TaxID=3154394 RepID=UPI003325DA95